MGENLYNAIIFLQNKRYDLAEKELFKEISKVPENGYAYSLLANALHLQNKNEKFFELALKGVTYNPLNAFSHYILSLAYHHVINDNEKALLSIKEAIRLDPDDEDYYGYYANLELIMGSVKKSINLIDKALSIAPDNLYCKKIQAIILQSQGKFIEAKAIASEILFTDPENIYGLTCKGYEYMDKRDYKNAKQIFSDILRLKPDNKDAKEELKTLIKIDFIIFRIFYTIYISISKIPLILKNTLLLWISFLMVISIYNQIKYPYIKYIIFSIIMIFFFIIFLPWVIDSFMNIILFFDKHGKYLLGHYEKISIYTIYSLSISGILLFIVGSLIKIPELILCGKTFLIYIIPYSYLLYNVKRKYFKLNLIIFSLILIIFICLIFSDHSFSRINNNFSIIYSIVLVYLYFLIILE